MDYLMLMSGVIVGVLTGFFYSQSRNKARTAPEQLELQKLSAELLAAKQLLQQRNEDYEVLKIEIATVRGDLNLSIESTATWKGQAASLNEKLESQKAELEEIQGRFQHEFRNLAGQLLEEKSKKFTEVNRENMDAILKPLREKLGEFEKKVEESHKEGLLKNEALLTQLNNLQQLNLQMSKEAENLTKALKGDNKAQGNWGEFILESVLEKSGLVKDREYSIQASHSDEDGNRLQPDVVIRLPESKAIVIDSKVSLVAYERFSSEEDNDRAHQACREHIASLRGHIKGLSAKNYQNLHNLKSLDFVLLFIPVEPAFALAVQTEPAIFQEAFDRNIVLVSPTTLLATLRTISSIWRQEYQNRNALEIARKGADLYDKFVSFTDDLTKLGTQMDTARKTYDDAVKKLHTGNGNLVRKAEEMRKLGIANSKKLGPKFNSHEDSKDDNEPEPQD
jgi:DNA recombination protein RmuC